MAARREVAPRTGAWIETEEIRSNPQRALGQVKLVPLPTFPRKPVQAYRP